MFFSDHAPLISARSTPSSKAVIDIGTLQVTKGELPRRAQHLVIDWAELHQAELLRDWELCQANRQPEPIAPLK